MALNLGRWFKYAQARLDAAVQSGNDELDDLEAEREADLADRPWLAADDEVPTFDEAKARIQAELPQPERPNGPPGRVSSAGKGADDAAAADDADAPDAPDAEMAAAKVELEQRQKDAAKRLDAIRDELGIEPPGPGSP